MTYTCPACNLKEDLNNQTLIAISDQEYEVRCIRCFQLLEKRKYSEDEEKDDICVGCALEKYMLTSDQCRYSLHLYQKQLDKIQNAMDQLNEMITKTQLLEELALEREAEDAE